MKKTIEIISKQVKPTPVAYYSKACNAVYFPGKQGSCLKYDGTKSRDIDYSHINFDNLPGYEPLYPGDVIRLVAYEEITL